MSTHLQYREILEGAEGLSIEEQETLLGTLRSRLRERRRRELARDVRRAQKEFKLGHSHPSTPAELMKEILS